MEGGRASLARELGVSPQAVYQWVKGIRPVSPRLAIKIESLTGVSRYDLRVDVFGPAPAGEQPARGGRPRKKGGV